MTNKGNIIKVLIIDDSALVRQTFKSLLETDPEITVIATARDPFVAAERIANEKPDVITLDMVMPKMDGLTFLQKLMKQFPLPVVVISDQTTTGANMALKALEYGATDFIAKPNISSDKLIEETRVMLIDKVKSAYYAGENSKVKKGDTENENSILVKASSRQLKPNTIIAIGASTGGTEALRELLQALPKEMPPILIVQHMPEKFTASFAERLNQLCDLNVKEAKHNDLIEPNTVYIAPGNFHMSIISSVGHKYIKISQGELVNRHRPSVNVLFNSAAAHCGNNSIGIILTGMGDDGATGMKNMLTRGAFTIAQDEKTSVVFGMPKKAISLNAVRQILPLEEISKSVFDYIYE